MSTYKSCDDQLRSTNRAAHARLIRDTETWDTRRQLASEKTLELVLGAMAKVHVSFNDRQYRHVHMLLGVGLDPNYRDSDGLTLLMKCCLCRETRPVLAVVRALLSDNKADKTLTDLHGRDALAYAAMHDRLHVARMIIGNFDVDIRHKDVDGNTPLHLAVEYESDRVACMLVRILCKYRLSVDDVNNVGMTPLMAACRRGHGPLIDLLIENGRASFTMRDNVYFRNAREWLAHSSAKHDVFRSGSAELPQRARSSVSSGAKSTKPRLYRRRVSSAPLYRSSELEFQTDGIKPPQPDILRDLFDIYVTQASAAYRDAAPKLPPGFVLMSPFHLSGIEPPSLSPTSRVRKAVRQVNRADRVMRTVRMFLGGEQNAAESNPSAGRPLSPTDKPQPEVRTSVSTGTGTT